jgi:hypothetical protein
MSLMPCILDKTQLFLEHLDHYATTGEEFSLDNLCKNLTFDIIGECFFLSSDRYML